jgi:hypothetical protein
MLARFSALLVVATLHPPLSLVSMIALQKELSLNQTPALFR